jgi:tRNA threonylcarbamoyladenosine biosynthesis protein TsaB
MTSRVWSVERLLERGASAGPILGFDTGGPRASLGLVADGRIQAVLSRLLPSHCAGLPAAIDELLAAAGLALGDLRGIGVALGPGSFTGLRVGLSYAKGLARAAGIPLAGISTLDAMALTAGSDLPAGVVVCPVLDARRGEVYAALYRFSADALERETDDLALTIAELAELINGEAILIGDAKAGDVQTLAAAKGLRTTLLGAAEVYRTGSLVAALAAARIARNDADESAALEPRYVRAPGATRATAI